MSGKKRGVIQMLWKYFIQSLPVSFKQRKLVGEDYYGTKYYELSSPSNSTNKRPSRYFVPVNKDDFTQELPAEWEAWLRYRRKEPPTKEELEKNYLIAMMTKRNAAELETKFSSDKKIKEPLQKKEQLSFPTYEEYKDDGADYKVKHK